MEKKSFKVLVVEDDPNYFILVNERLSQNRDPTFELIRSKHMQSGIERLGEGGIDVVLLDLMLPDSEGLNTFLSVHKACPSVPVIILTSLDDDDLAAQSIAWGGSGLFD